MHSLNRKSCRAPKFHRILTKSADLLFNPGRIGENPPKAMEVKLCFICPGLMRNCKFATEILSFRRRKKDFIQFHYFVKSSV